MLITPLTALPTAAITSDQFRNDLGEFADTNTFLDSTINYWLKVGTLMLNPYRWPNDGTAVLGLEMFAAHNLVIEALAQQTGVAGGIPGLSKGVISSESTGGVSLGYDTASALETGAGHWNLTIYGTRFIRLVKLLGIGGLQIGAGGAGFWNSAPIEGAWTGPDVYPGFTSFSN